MPTHINDLITAHRLVTDFLITGRCPEGIRPEFMDKLADLLVAIPKRREMPGQLSGQHYRAVRDGVVTVWTNDINTARRHGKVKANFLRLVK